MNKISVIVPCYNEQEVLSVCYQRIKSVLEKIHDIDYEIIFGDDGSSDNTLQIIKELANNNENVKYISLSRNFGKESIMYALLKKASGDFVTVIDADLQDPPELIEEMYIELQKGEYDCVATRRVDRKGEPKIRSFFAKMFYKIINKFTKLNIVDGARDFRMMTRPMVNAVLDLSEYNRFSKGIFQWVGFKTKWLEFQNIERTMGQTKWSFKKLMGYGMDGIVSFTTTPLYLASILGVILFFVAVIMIIVIILKTVIYGESVQGWPSLVCIIFFLNGLQFLCIGILGQYMSKLYMEVKARPIYIIKEEK